MTRSPSRHTPLLLLILCLAGLTGCASFQTRLTKVLLPSDFAYAMEPAPPPAIVTFKTGYQGDLPEIYRAPRAREDEETPLSRPPIVTRDGWIEVTPQHGVPVQVKAFLRNTDAEATEFFEIKSITGDLPYQVPSEIRFVDHAAPVTQPVRIVLKNLKSPYNGYDINDGALLLVEVLEPATQKTWRYLWLYKDFGSRQKISFNVVFNVPLTFLKDLGVPNVGNGVGNAAFTMSYSYGYRFRTQNDIMRWVGDKVAIVGLLGTSGVPVFGRQIFSNLSVGGGLEFYDFLSMNLLMDTSAFGNFKSGQWGVVVGFDAVRAAAFTRKLTQKLFKTNQLK